MDKLQLNLKKIWKKLQTNMTPIPLTLEKFIKKSNKIVSKSSWISIKSQQKSYKSEKNSGF